jgi:hypothetical protein
MFLRRVEQAEAALLPATERGGVVPLRRYKGPMTRRLGLSSGAADETCEVRAPGQRGRRAGTQWQMPHH